MGGGGATESTHEANGFEAVSPSVEAVPKISEQQGTVLRSLCLHAS